VPPTVAPRKDQGQFQALADDVTSKTIGDAEFSHRSNWIEKRPDRRTAPGKIELRVNVTVPVTKSEWSGTTTIEPIFGDQPKLISGQVQGKRDGPQWDFQISVSVEDAQPEAQPELFSDKSASTQTDSDNIKNDSKSD